MTTAEPTFKPPTKEFLDSIFERFSSERFKRNHELTARSYDFERALQALRSESQPRVDREAAQAIAAEMGSTRALFDGLFIQDLRQLALSQTGEDRDLLEPVAVVACPTHSLNAIALLSPRGEAAIVLNLGVLGVLQLVIKASLAHMTWHDSNPYCRDSPQESYGAALVSLTEFVFTGDFECLAPHRKTLSIVDPQHRATQFTRIGEIFIVLHEYGHLREGHLKRQGRSMAPGARATIEYTRQQRLELEADAYAIKRLTTGPHPLAPSMACLMVGFLFRFFALCEAAKGQKSGSRTHPPALTRWELIKDRSAVLRPTEEDGDADRAAARMVRALDLSFDKIEAGLAQ